MVPFRDLTISKKLTRANMIVSASVLLFVCAAFVTYELGVFKKNAAEQLSSNAEIVGINVLPALLFNDDVAATETLAALRALPHIGCAAIYRSDGTMFAKYARAPQWRAALPEQLNDISNNQRSAGNQLIVTRQIVSDGKTAGIVYIDSDLREIDQRLKSYGVIAFAVLLCSFAAALLVSSALQKRIVEPILNLAETARTIAAKKDYSLRADVRSKDETGILADSFNDMLRQIEEQNHTLQESERNFRELADAMPQIVWTATADGRPDYYNQRWFEYAGGASWSDTVSPEDAETYRAPWAESVRTGTPYNIEQRIRRAADGAWRWHLVRALPVRDNHGRITRWFGTFTDIDDQKKTEAEIARAARDRQLLLESTGEGIYVIDINGDCTMVNRVARTLFGNAPDDDLIGSRIHDLVHHHRADGSPFPIEECAIDRAMHTGVSCRVTDEVFWRKDGTSFPVEYLTSPIIDDGVVRGAVTTFSDVTERRQMERRIEQLDRVNSLGRMAATIAHEFNNVLMGIQPFAEILHRTAGHDPSIQKATSQILNSVKRGRGITQDIMRMTRVSQPSLQSVDMTDWLEQLTVEVRVLAGVRITVQLDVPPPRSLFARCDPVQMQQVVTNLSLNARDAMPGGGTLTISAGRAAEGVRLVIADTGCGIPPETLPFVFEPLFTTKHSGTGLGLAVAQQLVIRSGGTISVESTPDHGTRFQIDLPAALQAAPVVPDPEHLSAASMGVHKVVIVEDDPAVASGLASLLEAENVETRVVSLGGEASPAVAEFEPDVVLIDVSLPDMNGTEVYNELARRWPEIRVIFSTGHADESLLAVPKLKHIGFLRKPYDAETLLMKLREVM